MSVFKCPAQRYTSRLTSNSKMETLMLIRHVRHTEYPKFDECNFEGHRR
jgi:hypothetical protein